MDACVRTLSSSCCETSSSCAVRVSTNSSSKFPSYTLVAMMTPGNVRHSPSREQKELPGASERVREKERERNSVDQKQGVAFAWLHKTIA